AAILLNKNNADIYYRFGITLQKKERFKEAVEEFDKAIHLNQGDAYTWSCRAWTYKRLGQMDKAIADYTRALKLSPKDHWNYRDRGDAYAALRQYDKAIDDLAAYIQSNPNDPVQWYRLGLLRIYMGDTYGYRKLCADMAQRFGQTDDEGAVHHLVWTCMLSENALADFRPVLQAAQKMAGESPKELSKLSYLSAALYRAGHLEEAVEKLKEAEKLEPDLGVDFGECGFWHNLVLALAHGRLGRLEEAKKRLAKADAWLKEHAKGIFWAERLQAEVLRR